MEDEEKALKELKKEKRQQLHEWACRDIALPCERLRRFGGRWQTKGGDGVWRDA